MINEEIKKIIFKQKGLWIFAIALVLKCLFVLNEGVDADLLIDSNSEGYHAYLEKYAGELTEDKIQAFKAEEVASDFVLKDIAQLDQKRNDNQISQENYVKQMEIYMKRLNDAQIFDVMSSKYQYAIADVAHRYIMDDRGWKAILANNNPDIIFILLILLMAGITFNTEFEEGIHLLNLSMKKGKRTLFHTKVIVVLMGSMISILTFAGIEWGVTQGLVGLNGGSYPLQSIQFFKETAFHGTIIQAFVMVWGLRLIGTVVLVSIMAWLSSVIRQTVPVVILGMIAFFAPFVVVRQLDILYRLPLPSGLICSEGYLFGTQVAYRENMNRVVEKIVTFQALGPSELFCVVVGSLGLSWILLGAARRRYKDVR